MEKAESLSQSLSQEKLETEFDSLNIGKFQNLELNKISDKDDDFNEIILALSAEHVKDLDDYVAGIINDEKQFWMLYIQGYVKELLLKGYSNYPEA